MTDGRNGWTAGLAALVILVLAHSASALPSRVHALLAYEATQAPGVPDEIAYGPYIGVPDNPIADDLDNSLCEGAFDEDYDRSPKTLADLFDIFNPTLIWGQGTHFWDPAGGPEGGQLFILNPEHMNAYQRAAMLYRQAIQLYPIDRPGAYYLLGRVSHLLTDMATPAHTHMDAHVADALADFINEPNLSADSFENYLARRYTTRGDLPSDPDPTGRLRLEQELLASPIYPVTPFYLGDGGRPDQGTLYKLFYSMARHATRWDSNDEDGTGSAGIGGGSLRWRRSVNVLFADPDTLSVAVQDGHGNVTKLHPIATIGHTRVLLPDFEEPRHFRIRIRHDGVTSWVNDTQVLRFGQISDADVQRIAEDLMPRSVAYVKALYRLFWRDTHPGDTSIDLRPLPGDVDADGSVSMIDVVIVLANFGLESTTPEFNPRADLDDSGQVDIADLLLVIVNFGLTSY